MWNSVIERHAGSTDQSNPPGDAIPSACQHSRIGMGCKGRALWIGLLTTLAFMFLAPSASAIPAFARRYETSCQTCHVAFPRLTPFGEAFRRNAYRFPLGDDATAEKEEPIALGSEAHKDLWPKAVYSGQIARTVPISLLVEARAVAGPSLEGHSEMEGTSNAHDTMDPAATSDHSETKVSFAGVGGNARLLAGGSLGSIGGFFAAISFGEHAPVDVERGFVVVTPLSQSSLHLKAGRFEPSLHGVSIHRGMLGHQLRLTTTPVLLNTFTPEGSLRGFEASGLVRGRFAWFLGVVENMVAAEGIAKDYYGRLEAKWGGMRLDGAYAAAGSAPWSERSLMFGVSAYRGNAVVTDTISMPGMPMLHTDTFVRAGMDIHGVLNNLLVDVVVAVQRHELAGVAEGSRTTMQLAYGEVTYVTFPWLFPTVRFEASRLTGGSAPSTDPRWIGIAAINAVVRPNLLLRVEAAGGADPGHHAAFRFAALHLAAAF